MPRLYANSIDPNAVLVHGAVSYNAIDSATRHAVLESTYWKEKLFGINAVGVVDRALSLHYIGSVSGSPPTPTRFLCLLVKLLQLMPPFDVILEMLKQPTFRYLRCLAILFIRLTASPADVHRVLEALLPDFRPIKVKPRDGPPYTSSVDEFIGELLRSEAAWGGVVPLRTLPPRALLVQRGELDERESALREDVMGAVAGAAAAAGGGEGGGGSDGGGGGGDGEVGVVAGDVDEARPTAACSASDDDGGE